MTKNLLSVVVLFWNDSEKTIKCLNSIYNQKNIKFSLILVDNNSNKKYSEKVLNWLKKKKINIKYIKKKKINTTNSKKKCFYIKNNINLGCGLGHNPAYAISIKNKFKYIARIDNDMFLPPRLLSALVRRLNMNKNIIAISPKIMFESKPKLIWFRGTHIGNNLKFQTQCGNYTPGHLDNKKYKGLINTDSVVGCASIMRADILKKSGLSDPDFFYGEEDIELSHRLKKNNGELKIDLDQKIYHSVSATVGKNWAKNIYYNYKYRLLLVKKIGTFWDKFFGYLISIIKLFISFIFILNRKESSKIIQRYFALKHFFQGKFGEFDRKNYSLVDNFFSKISKNTTCFDMILILKNKNFS
jgi:GT2 family glycosyltransferase